MGIGQTKGSEPVSIFSQSLQLDLGGKGRSAPNFGGSLSACHATGPYSLQPVGTSRVAERSGPASPKAAFGP